tara:strand:- start:3005 stop:3265 length:261 start_codon:yes stop_codon:yes gene_type:complete
VSSNNKDIRVGDIVREVNYIAYFNSPMEARIGLVIDLFESKNNPALSHTHQIAKVYWLKNKIFERVPVYLLIHCVTEDEEYQCEKI